MAEPPAEARDAPLAVIDVGSNSVRLLIARPRPGGHLEILDEARVTLRLARVVDAHGCLPPAALERTVGAIADFMTLAERAGVASVRAVGTAALRDASNASALAAALRERCGVELEVLGGKAEVRFAALGAVFGLPIEDGLLLDLGGGSLLLARIEDRAPAETWSFPLGTLRLTDRFLPSDPPSREELAALRHHVRAELASAGVPRLAEGEALVGTGGTVRNLANVSRRGRRYPIARLHGYALSKRRLGRIAERLGRLPAAERGAVGGLNPDRAEIIVAGALAVATVVAHTRAREVLVAGQGLREGVARSGLLERLPPAEEVRRASVAAFARRFGDRDGTRAEQRARIAGELLAVLDSGAGARSRETVEHAAMLLDVGAAVDFYRRSAMTTAVLLDANLAGFSPLQVARLAAAARIARRPAYEPRVLRPLLSADDDAELQRAGATIALADELQRRSEPGGLRVRREGDALRVELAGAATWDPGAAGARVSRLFAVRLTVEARAAPAP